jgi:hypothetical protein
MDVETRIIVDLEAQVVDAVREGGMRRYIWIMGGGREPVSGHGGDWIGVAHIILHRTHTCSGTINMTGENEEVAKGHVWSWGRCTVPSLVDPQAKSSQYSRCSQVVLMSCVDRDLYNSYIVRAWVKWTIEIGGKTWDRGRSVRIGKVHDWIKPIAGK